MIMINVDGKIKVIAKWKHLEVEEERDYRLDCDNQKIHIGDIVDYSYYHIPRVYRGQVVKFCAKTIKIVAGNTAGGVWYDYRSAHTCRLTQRLEDM